MSVLQWQMDVYNRLRKSLPNTRVFLEGVPENSRVPPDHTGLIKPMVIIWFGQITQEDDFKNGSGDLCGIEVGGDSPGVMSLAIEVVAPSGLALIQLSAHIRKLLTGYQPDGKGQLIEGGVATIRDPLPVGIGAGLRFYVPMFFSGRIG